MKNWTPQSGLRHDTNNIDELFLKTHLRWKASENHTIDLNLLHTDVDNGYDGFSLDNTRTTHSDQPGTDAQKTNAFALTSNYESEDYKVITKVSHSSTKLLYSYDDDWSYVGEFDNELAIINDGVDQNSSDYVWPYSGFDRYSRDQKVSDFDTRIISNENSRILNNSTDWTLGLYAQKFNEDLFRHHAVDYDDDLFFYSDYETTNTAIYGQLDTHLNDKLTLITGLRVDKWKATYNDSNDVSIKNDETMVGGKVGLNYQHNDNLLYFTTLSKGYKPGGVNAGTDLAPEDKTFGTETLWNLEAGVNSSHFNNTLVSRLNVFYGKRKDMQVKLYEVDSHEFTDYLSNASKGTYYGIESQLNYRVSDALSLYSSVGLLKATFDEYSPEMEGRDIAHAPRYQYLAGLNYFFAENWKFNTDVEGKGSYYFSNTHSQKSDAYTLWNASLEYVKGSWTTALWARNITNEEYFVRGFYWGNNPVNDNYAPELYTQKGNPRTIGLTVSYDF